MPRAAAEVLKDALALSLEARAALVGRLLESLAGEAWRGEIVRRLQEIDRGTAKLVPWDEARRRLVGRRLG